MRFSPSIVKLLKTVFENEILSKNWLKKLIENNFYDFEKLLYEKLLSLYDKICEVLLTRLSTSPEFLEIQKTLAKKKGLKKLEFRPLEVQLRTGTKIKFDSLYAKKVPKRYKGKRHLPELYWSLSLKSSPMYQSITCLFSVICPSFEVAKNLLRYQGVQANFDRTRTLSLSLAEGCMLHRSKIQLAPNESLCGKRVIIGIDGGRTRTRVYKNVENSKRKQKYDTPWREPKLFVITTIDKNGKVNKQDLPIYDCSFGDDETFGILEQYLKALDVKKAKNVQVIGDGAPWIWNRAKPMLVRLGVDENKIIETLDHYHAMEHLTELMLYVEENQKTSILKKLKECLSTGNLAKMKRLIKKGIPGVNLKEFNPYMYFERNKQRIGYQHLKDQKRPIGSGIIESGIRRIINLRFKSPSSFWYPENVEKLILMRAIALSGRWEIMMNNLMKFKN